MEDMDSMREACRGLDPVIWLKVEKEDMSGPLPPLEVWGGGGEEGEGKLEWVAGSGGVGWWWGLSYLGCWAGIVVTIQCILGCTGKFMG